MGDRKDRAIALAQLAVAIATLVLASAVVTNILNIGVTIRNIETAFSGSTTTATRTSTLTISATGITTLTVTTTPLPTVLTEKVGLKFTNVSGNSGEWIAYVAPWSHLSVVYYGGSCNQPGVNDACTIGFSSTPCQVLSGRLCNNFVTGVNCFPSCTFITSFQRVIVDRQDVYMGISGYVGDNFTIFAWN